MIEAAAVIACGGLILFLIALALLAWSVRR